MPAIIPDAIYTVHQTAAILHCSARSVYRYIEAHQLRAKKRGKTTLLLGRDLLAFFESLTDADGVDHEAEDGE